MITKPPTHKDGDEEKKQIIISKPPRPIGPSEAKQLEKILAINKQTSEEVMKDHDYMKKRDRYVKALTKRANQAKMEDIKLIVV